MSTADAETSRLSYESSDVAVHRLVSEIAHALVNSTSPVQVCIVEENGVKTLNVRTDADGVGRLLGSQGRTVRAIRTILTAFASKSQHSFGLDIQKCSENDVD